MKTPIDTDKMFEKNILNFTTKLLEKFALNFKLTQGKANQLLNNWLQEFRKPISLLVELITEVPNQCTKVLAINL